jgi:hypothetical protein
MQIEFIVIPSEVEEPRGITLDVATGCFDFARHDKSLT